ncbi:MMPL family transporter [Solirubrobacter phytolaccae]|uniref:MMPL family transporter n=1 Tax=Solirubrobacter phytolaccae TaxID=1404360 RepID=A0A9X3NF90_9ACTN|nr:MMPL family transporter [Solirubrobacter phytolaccae]MDA0184966.1 MMPL family transporter [Solirubrobacter phytolaccae]
MPTTPISPPPIDRTGRWLASLTQWVLAHKRLVAVAWLVLTLAGFYGSAKVTGALDENFTMPNSASTVTNERIVSRFDSGGGTPPLVAVVTLPPGTTASAPAVRADLRALEQDLARAVPGARIASFGSTSEPAYVSDDGRTTFAVLHPPSSVVGDNGPSGSEIDEETVARAAQAAADARVGGAEVRLTGNALLTSEAAGESGPAFLSETLLAGVGALIVLVFVFASALALVPLLMAIVSIPVTLLAVWGLTALTEVNIVVVFLVSLIGLGVAIDYALLVVMRWREERERGLSNEQAIVHAAGTAGRAVLFSGTTVAIGLLAALVLPVPFLRSMGIGGLLIPLASVAVALTLLPVVLATVGPFADARRLRRTDRAERHWAAWARLVIRHRIAATLAGAALLVALCVAAQGILLGSPEARSLGGTGAPKAALQQLERSGIGAAPLAPVEVLTPADRAADTAARLAAVDGVRAASAPEGAWRADGQAVVEVLTRSDTNSQAGRATIGALRDAAATLPATTIGGSTAQTIDFVDAVYGSFPLMLALISIVTFVLLARAFRSIVLPAKAIAMNLLSVFATWGVMTLVWQHGVGTELLFGVGPDGAVQAWAPVIVFAFIYGLSMDYEVFILARMREEYDRTGSTDEAVVRGMAGTGRLVTSAALIVFLAFASMATAGDRDLQVLATGLAAGVLLDALVVRSLLVPATVSWLGRWNWWMPERGRRLLRLPAVTPATES